MSAHTSPHVFDADDGGFQAQVIERSHTTPVVVDLWADWCGPCRTLGPMLEAAIDARDGAVVLAKVDVDANPGVAQAFRVQGIPAVFGIRDGKVVSQFTGVRPAAEIDRFLDELVPSEADRAVARARTLEGEAQRSELRRALELDPGHRDAAIALAETLVDEDAAAALELVQAHRPDPAAEAIATRADLARGAGGDVAALSRAADEDPADGETLVDLGRALAAAGQYDEAIERLLAAVELGDGVRDTAREQLVALFGVLGDDDDRVRAARPRLARALF